MTKHKEIYIEGKRYEVGGKLEGDHLKHQLAMGRKVLYTKSWDVYAFQQLVTENTYDRKVFCVWIPSQKQWIKSARRPEDVIMGGAYKLIPAWMEA